VRRVSDRGELLAYDEIIAVLETLPVILREARRRKGLSTREAADQLGVSFSSVSRWERASQCVPDRPAIIRILRWAAS
jgi:transcriptional regulator with XRE-family HTH domain